MEHPLFFFASTTHYTLLTEFQLLIVILIHFVLQVVTITAVSAYLQVIYKYGRATIILCLSYISIRYFFTPFHFKPITIVAVGKETRTLIGPWWYLPRQHPLLEVPQELMALCRRTLGGTQLRDLINSRLTRWRMAVYT